MRELADASGSSKYAGPGPSEALAALCRKEVAELRGSLQPFARGAVVTTSHFSKAAISEACEEGKNPITLVDGFRLSKVVLDEDFQLPV